MFLPEKVHKQPAKKIMPLQLLFEFSSVICLLLCHYRRLKKVVFVEQTVHYNATLCRLFFHEKKTKQKKYFAIVAICRSFLFNSWNLGDLLYSQYFSLSLCASYFFMTKRTKQKTKN